MAPPKATVWPESIHRDADVLKLDANGHFVLCRVCIQHYVMYGGKKPKPVRMNANFRTCAWETHKRRTRAHKVVATVYPSTTVAMSQMAERVEEMCLPTSPFAPFLDRDASFLARRRTNRQEIASSDMLGSIRKQSPGNMLRSSAYLSPWRYDGHWDVCDPTNEPRSVSIKTPCTGLPCCRSGESVTKASDPLNISSLLNPRTGDPDGDAYDWRAARVGTQYSSTHTDMRVSALLNFEVLTAKQKEPVV